jgi:ABC-type glycerol-3-phosphate transport system substrate-binding protein
MNMVKKTSRILVILCSLLVVVCLFGVVGCKKGPSLKGEEIVLAQWWEDYDVNTYQPRNASEEKTLEWRTKIQKENGFTMRSVNVAGWGEWLQESIQSTLAGDPIGNITFQSPDWAMALLRQGLIAPLDSVKSIDLRNPRPVGGAEFPVATNTAVLDGLTVGGKPYGFQVEIGLHNAQVVFFNKRHYREAGLDPNLPYDLQKANTWTWDAYLDICRQLTRDIDNDGVIDRYAMPSGSDTEILQAFVSSNGSDFAAVDPSTGRFINPATRPEFLEALQFLYRLLNEGVVKRPPPNANWDWFKSDFVDGGISMFINDSWMWNNLADMRDEWGMVLPPRGPRASKITAFAMDNVITIPATFSAEEVDKYVYATALWYSPQEEDWKSGYYSQFRDARAVDETLTMIRDPEYRRFKVYMLTPLGGNGIGPNFGWGFWDQGDPSTIIETITPLWNAIFDDLNNDLFGR